MRIQGGIDDAATAAAASASADAAAVAVANGVHGAGTLVQHIWLVNSPFSCNDLL